MKKTPFVIVSLAILSVVTFGVRAFADTAPSTYDEQNFPSQQQDTAIPAQLDPNAKSEMPPLHEEALQACDGREEGEGCAFLSPEGETISGTCAAPPDVRLACVPIGFDPSNREKVR